MLFSYYCFLIAVAWANASPNPQSSPSSLAPTVAVPCQNNAIWQEAVANDEKLGNGSTDTRLFYYNIANMQTLEFSSNGSQSDTILQASEQSQALQALKNYAMDYNQPQALTSQVEISSTPQQTINSFGISGAWWPNDLDHFPSAEQQNLSTLLFDKDWLYVSAYRYNVGASGDQDALAIDPAGRAVQSFMKTDGTYDWTRDGPGTYYLNAAKEADVSSITFFLNAQPSGLTSNHEACGSTLDSAAIAAYVAYIEKVVAYWVDQGITIDYVSPMNEPDNDFQSCKGSTCTCGQEGMQVPVDTRSAVFQQLRAALAASTSAGAQKVKIMGDETSQITQQALKEYINSYHGFLDSSQGQGWLVDTLSGEYIDAISVHMYDFPDDPSLRNFKQLVINASAAATPPRSPPPIKMTEISSFASAPDTHAPWGWTGPDIMTSEYDPTMDSALDTARMIWQFMTLVNAESWDWWTAVSTMLPCAPSTDPTCPSTYASGQGWNDALIYIDPAYATNQNYDFYLTKRFWVFKHFTTFVRPGAVRYDIPNESLPYAVVAMASLGTDATWNTVFINRNTTAQTITLNLAGSGGKILGMTQTTATADWQSMPLPTVSKADTVTINLPARSVLSMQFSVTGSTGQTEIASRGIDFGDEGLEERDENAVWEKVVERTRRKRGFRSPA